MTKAERSALLGHAGPVFDAMTAADSCAGLPAFEGSPPWSDPRSMPDRWDTPGAMTPLMLSAAAVGGEIGLRERRPLAVDAEALLADRHAVDTYPQRIGEQSRDFSLDPVKGTLSRRLLRR